MLTSLFERNGVGRLDGFVRLVIQEWVEGLSVHHNLQLKQGKEQSMMYRLCSSVSPKWLAWDCGTWIGMSQVCCLPLYCCHTSFSPEHDLSALHPIISFENIWKPLPASSNCTHGIQTPLVERFQELIWREKIVESYKSMGVDVCVTQLSTTLSPRENEENPCVSLLPECVSNWLTNAVLYSDRYQTLYPRLTGSISMYCFTDERPLNGTVLSSIAMTLNWMYTSFRQLFRASITGRSLWRRS